MKTSSNYFRSRPEQLADYLRDRIARGEITQPLPVTRIWSKTLNVGRPTLQQALAILRREGLLAGQPRHPSKLKKMPRRMPGNDPFRVVRIIVRSRDLPLHLFAEYIAALSLRLNPHGIHLAIERCSHGRLKAISRQAAPSNEVFLLWSLPSAWLLYFSRWTHNALICGAPHPSSPLSYLAVDLDGAMRHATQSLMRRGFSRISFLVRQSAAQGVQQAINVFHQTCKDWPHQPIVADCIYLPNEESEELRHSARRFAKKIRPRHGIISTHPSFVSMIMSALLEQNFVIPRDAEIYALSTSPEKVRMCPPVTFYPFPIDAEVRTLAEAIFHFFQTGSLPRMRKTLTMEAQKPDDS